MADRKKNWRDNLRFKAAVAGGVVLAFVSAGVSVWTFVFVSRHQALDHLGGEAGRIAGILEYRAQDQGIQTIGQLNELLQQAEQREPGKVAWLRVVDREGGTIAQSGSVPEHASFSDQETQDVLVLRRRNIVKTVPTADGDVLVSILPFRFQFQPGTDVQNRLRFGEGGRMRGFKLIEVALNLHGADDAFMPLKRNLAVGVAAPLALLAAVVIIVLRFPGYLRGRELEEQLALARRVQRDLLPSGNPETDRLAISSEFIPYWGVGGDYFDVFSLPSGRTFVVLGDVSGKGLPAALLMGLLHGAIRSASHVWDGTNHHELAAQANRLLVSGTASNRFVTLFWACYESHENQLRFVNAGHNPPLLVRRRSDGSAEIEELRSGGPVLGLLRDAVYQGGSTSLCPGDLIVAYSDGLVEATNAEDVEFGQARLEDVLRECNDLPPGRLKGEILSRLWTFLEGVPLQDDLTLLVVQAEPAHAGEGAEQRIPL